MVLYSPSEFALVLASENIYERDFHKFDAEHIHVHLFVDRAFGTARKAR